MANKDWLRQGADGLTFGERLDDLYRSRGITQSQLAEETGINQSAISEYINGKNGGTGSRAPDCASIIALSKYFSVSTDYLLGLTTTKSINEDVQAVCRVTGLEDDHIYNLMGLIEPQDAPYLRDMVNEFLSYAVDDRAIITYKDFRKYIDMDNQRWRELNNLSQEDYEHKAEQMRQFMAAAEENGYLIMSYGYAAEKEWKKLQEEYGQFLLSRYRRFDKHGNPRKREEDTDGID